jgi:Arc/MetJ-type ribon-helix-helix transcriptional regulator
MKLKSIKSVTKRIPVTLTQEQARQINEKIGLLGSNQSDVLRYIITNWLDEYNKRKKE